MRSRTVLWMCGLVCLGAALEIGPPIVRAQSVQKAPAQTHAESSSQGSASRSSAPPPALLLSTAGAADAGQALDSVLSSSIEELNVVRIVARPGLDLGAVQLALDCVAETAPCLQAVVSQSDAQVLIAPTLQRTSSELVLGLLRFDARSGEMRRVARRQPGSVLGSALLDAIPGMVRELFGLPPPPPKPAPAPPKADSSLETGPASTEAEPMPEAPMEPPTRPSSVVGPILVGSAGVLVLGAGFIVGGLMKGNQSDYNKLLVSTPAAADRAADKRSTAKTEAAVANVLFGVGAAAVAAGGIWLAVQLTNRHPADSSSDTDTAWAPMLGPGALGLVFTRRGGGL
jgi:hypothetical protein